MIFLTTFDMTDDDMNELFKDSGSVSENVEGLDGSDALVLGIPLTFVLSQGFDLLKIFLQRSERNKIRYGDFELVGYSMDEFFDFKKRIEEESKSE